MMEATGVPRASRIVAALDGLDDAGLHAVIARAQALLLDRPPAPEDGPGLTVEIVVPEERRLLVAYRALVPGTRRALLERAERLVRPARPLWAHQPPRATGGRESACNAAR